MYTKWTQAFHSTMMATFPDVCDILQFYMYIFVYVQLSEVWPCIHVLQNVNVCCLFVYYWLASDRAFLVNQPLYIKHLLQHSNVSCIIEAEIYTIAHKTNMLMLYLLLIQIN